MIYIIGVIHQVQHGIGNENTKAIEHLERFLTEKSQEKRVQLIAEEASEDSLIEFDVAYTVSQKVAKNLLVKHLFCDPGLEKRRVLGIKSRRDIAKELGYVKFLTSADEERVNEVARPHDRFREKIWLERIKESGHNDILFVCGVDHVDPFLRQIEKQGMQGEILGRFS